MLAYVRKLLYMKVIL